MENAGRSEAIHSENAASPIVGQCWERLEIKCWNKQKNTLITQSGSFQERLDRNALPPRDISQHALQDRIVGEFFAHKRAVEHP
jgi:hypothetical protein